MPASNSFSSTEIALDIPEPESLQRAERGPLSFSGGQQGQATLATQHEVAPISRSPEGRWARFKHWCAVIGRRMKAEFWAEVPYVKPRLLVIVLCLIFQYVHAVFTTLAYHLHEPLPEPLPDMGFRIFPELGENNQAISEVFVYTGFGAMAVWMLSPFVTRHKTFHAVVVVKRVLVVIVACQALRIVTFLATQIPGSNYHCRAGHPDATQPWPDHWWQNIIVNVVRQASHSCGDLIFSSHITFVLVFMWTYTVVGKFLLLKIFTFIYTIATSCLIIASRKHYSVDIVVAWYVLPLTFFHFSRRWTTQRDDVATPDGTAVISADMLGGAAGTAGSMSLSSRRSEPRGGSGKLEVAMGKLGMAGITSPSASLAERAASQHLLEAAERGGWEGEAESGLGAGAADTEEGGSLAAQHAQQDAAELGTAGSSSGVRGVVKGVVEQARGLPQRVGVLRGAAAGSRHQRTGSDGSSRVALRGGEGPSSSSSVSASGQGGALGRCEGRGRCRRGGLSVSVVFHAHASPRKDLRMPVVNQCPGCWGLNKGVVRGRVWSAGRGLWWRQVRGQPGGCW